MEKKPEIITISWFNNAYRANKPSWDGGKVVSLEDYNALQSQLSESEKRIKELEEEIETLSKFDER